MLSIEMLKAAPTFVNQNGEKELDLRGLNIKLLTKSLSTTMVPLHIFRITSNAWTSVIIVSNPYKTSNTWTASLQ